MPRSPEPEPSPLAKATSAAIRRMLADARYSQAEMSRETGLSTNYVSERLMDKKSFTLSDIELIADFFRVEPAVIFEAATTDVSAEDDAAVVDQLSILTREELAQRDLDLAALKDQEHPATAGEQRDETHDEDDDDEGSAR